MADPKQEPGYKLTAWSFLALVVVILVMGALMKASPERFRMPATWGVVAVTMILFLFALGTDLKLGRFGVLVSERNLMSLSRFQLVVWTILITSAFVAIGIARVFSGVDDPLAITVPPELWQILGISAASTVGATMVTKNKANKEPKDAGALAAKVGEQTHESGNDVDANRQGLNYGNSKPTDARITDMFEGDELANTAYIDMSKVQMFFFTLIAVIAYAVNIYQYMVDNTPETLTTFPALAPGLVAVLGISHAAYLGNKSVDKTKVQ